MSGVTALVSLALVGSGCARTEDPRPAPELTASANAEAAAPPTLAEATNEGRSLGVQVLAVRRVGADALRVELAIVNRLPAAAGPSELAAARAAIDGVAGMSLLSADGRRRAFALHDPSGRMSWSGLEPPAPGQRRQLWVLFPAFSNGETAGKPPRVTLVVPGWPALKDLPVRSNDDGS